MFKVVEEYKIVGKGVGDGRRYHTYSRTVKKLGPLIVDHGRWYEISYYGHHTKDAALESLKKYVESITEEVIPVSEKDLKNT